MRVLDGKTNNVADSAKGTLYDIGIKVRGQSSALFPKPGYGVEVRDEKGEGMDVSLFGLPPGDDWVFHGPYVDKSMMRNALAHWLFRQAGHYSPRPGIIAPVADILTCTSTVFIAVCTCFSKRLSVASIV